MFRFSTVFMWTFCSVIWCFMYWPLGAGFCVVTDAWWKGLFNLLISLNFVSIWSWRNQNNLKTEWYIFFAYIWVFGIDRIWASIGIFIHRLNFGCMVTEMSPYHLTISLVVLCLRQLQWKGYVLSVIAEIAKISEEKMMIFEDIPIYISKASFLTRVTRLENSCHG